MADKVVVYVAGDQTAVPVTYKDLGDGTYASTVPGTLAPPVNVLATGGAASTRATAGLTVDQGTADDEALALKSTGDVAHGMTGQANAATYGALKKVSGTDGGLKVIGLCDAGGQALMLDGMAPAADTGKTGGSVGAVTLRAQLQSGASVGAIGANGNLVVIDNDGTTKFIFDAEGDSHEDGTGWTAYDDHDDLALLNALDASLDARLRVEVGGWLRENKAVLEAARIVAFNDDTDGRPFVNRSRLQMLLVGAVRQLGRALDAQAAEIADLRTQLALPGA